MGEIIQIGGLAIKFLISRHESNGALDMFEFSVAPNAKVPMHHYHRDYDEICYGLAGTLTWTSEGVTSTLNPGDAVFIPRGQVHGFENRGDVEAKCLAITTPGLIGPEYFQEIAALIAQGGPPDPVRMKEIMLRFGLIPVPPAA